jgi:hypothetical protein
MPRAKKPGVINPGNNRTDLMTPKTVPDMVATGQGVYGRATAQQQSQRIIPIGGQSVQGPTSVPAASSGSQPTPAATPPVPAGPSAPTPGTLPWVSTPTQRPNEPLMTPATGAFGQLAAQQQNEQGSTRQLLGHLANLPGASSVIKGLAAAAGATVS